MSDLGKRKQSYVKWLMKRGVSLEKAKLMAYKKFYHEERVATKWEDVSTMENKWEQ